MICVVKICENILKLLKISISVIVVDSSGGGDGGSVDKCDEHEMAQKFEL